VHGMVLAPVTAAVAAAPAGRHHLAPRRSSSRTRSIIR
jgi:hypothetical protein